MLSSCTRSCARHAAAIAAAARAAAAAAAAAPPPRPRPPPAPVPRAAVAGDDDAHPSEGDDDDAAAAAAADAHAQCAAWAARGECEANAAFMRATCARSCRRVDDGAAAAARGGGGAGAAGAAGAGVGAAGAGVGAAGAGVGAARVATEEVAKDAEGAATSDGDRGGTEEGEVDEAAQQRFESRRRQGRAAGRTVTVRCGEGHDQSVRAASSLSSI